jgi:hypothetical protein
MQQKLLHQTIYNIKKPIHLSKYRVIFLKRSTLNVNKILLLHIR